MADKFTLDLVDFAKKTELEFSVVRRKVTLDILAGVTKRTPVDTGRLRASWAVSDGRPSNYAVENEKYSGSKNSPGVVEAQFQKPFDVSFVTNNLPYAKRIEYGHSKKRPNGMARITVAKVAAELKAATGG